ncbi:TAL effector repeat-containing protein [Pseudomonas sp. 10C3]|nr:TAL effector repeat-containing protein [Pseudomonas sp. 10C3]MEE3505819.1 TAL effector repeat-containing protein [Pseudomonas sp. 10C3]
MNPIQSGVSAQHHTASINAGQPLEPSGSQAQHNHPNGLSLAGMSRNTLYVLEQANGSHQLLAMLAINSIADNALHLQSTQGADAHYITAAGDFTVQARLNEQSLYDVIRISSPTASIYLSIPPITHDDSSSVMGGQQPSVSSHLATQYPVGQLAQAMILKHNPQYFSGDSLPSGASTSTPSMVFSHDGSAGAAADIPGPSWTRAAHIARVNPYPAPSLRSGASTQSAGSSSHALSTADQDKIQKRASRTTLDFVQQNLDQFQGMMSRENVINIAAHHGGKSALQALRDKGPALRQAGFSAADLLKVAANGGAAQALQVLLDTGPALRQAGFSAADLVKVAANGGAAQALQALRDTGPALRQVGFSAADLVKVAAHIGGAPALQALQANGPALRQAGFSGDDLVKIASTGGGRKTMETLLEVHPILSAGGVSQAQILALATEHRGASGGLQSKVDEIASAGH